MLNFLVRGGQIVLHYLQMLRQVLKALILGSVFSILLLVVVLIKMETKKFDFYFYGRYLIATHFVAVQNPNFLINVNFFDTKKIKLTAGRIVQNKIILEAKNRVDFVVKKNIIFGLKIYLYSVLSLFLCFVIKGYTMTKTNFVRGNKIVSVAKLNWLIIKTKGIITGIFYYLFGKKYKIGKVFYPKGTENLHTLITGTTGTGKTVLLNQLIEQIRKNGDKAIIYDKMGTFVEKFYDKNLDVILNPLDDRSPYWSIFNEAENSIDFEAIASALIPDMGNDPFFTLAARILFSSVAGELLKMGAKTNKDLTDKLLKIDLTEAAKIVKNTPAQSIIDEQNPKTALSVMSVLSTNLKSLEHLRQTPNKDGETFSIKDWVKQENNSGFLFFSSRSDHHETLKPLISTWVDIVINTLLSLKQSHNRKVWIIIDELPSLNFLPSLHSGLAESRQFGGCFVLAYQLPAQLKSIYGDRRAEATSGLCNTRVILRSPDKDTAEWASDSLGKIEEEEVKESTSFGANELRDGVSLNKNIIIKNIISATEIMNLESLTAYVKVAGNYPITKMKFKYKNYKTKSERFIARKEAFSEKIDETANTEIYTKSIIEKEEAEKSEKDNKELNNTAMNNMQENTIVEAQEQNNLKENKNNNTEEKINQQQIIEENKNKIEDDDDDDLI